MAGAEMAGMMSDFMGSSMNMIGDMTGLATKGLAFGMGATLGGQYAGITKEAQGATSDVIGETTRGVNAQLKDWWNRYYGGGYVAPSLGDVGKNVNGDANSLYQSGPINIAQQNYASMKGIFDSTSSGILEQGQAALATMTDDVASRVSGLTSSAANSLEQTNASIDEQVASKQLTPAAAAAMKEQAKFATGGQLVDKAREFHADLASRKAETQLQTMNTWAGFRSSMSGVLKSAGESVQAAYDQVAGVEQSLLTSIANNTIAEATNNYNLIMQTYGTIMQYGLALTGQLSGIGQSMMDVNWGEPFQVLGADLKQMAANRQQSQAQDSGGMF